MKKLFVKGGIALIGALLVLAFAACPAEDTSSLNDRAVMTAIQAETDTAVVDGTLGEAISSADWAVYTTSAALTEPQKGTLDFNSAAESVEVTFIPTASSKASVTYAVVKGTAIPEVGDFKNTNVKTPALATNDVLFFKVVSEDKKNTNYYCVIVTGLGNAPSNSTGISSVTIGDGHPHSPPQNAGHAVISAVEALPYSLPSANMTGEVTLTLNRNNSGQTISWAKTGATAVPADSNFAAFSATGNVLSAVVGDNGLEDEDKIYIKVVAADNSATLYYAYSVSVGGIAELASLSIGDTEVIMLGEPGTAWNNAKPGNFDDQSDTPPATYALAATAEDGGEIAWAVMNSTGAPASFTNLAGTPSLTLLNGSILYIRVTSVNTKVVRYYKINILMKSSTTVLYGQPDLTQGTGGNAPTLDPLWATTDWMFNVSRINLNEMAPAYKFLNTVDGEYETTGYGHTEGRAKAFWDDGGMYIYAEMSFHDYFAAEDAAAASVRVTSLSPNAATIADSNAHLYDSLEIFTNERLQAFTQGGYGIQYRVAPTADPVVAGTASRISGNPPSTQAGPAANAIAVFRDSGKYYTWIRKDGAKETGYSIVAYVPWIYRTDDNANQVFDSGKIHTTGNAQGPTVGVEFQLNAVTAGGVRDAILTWNGVTGQSYNQVRNYGKATLVTGDLTARGIVRGAKDPQPVKVSFNVDGGTPTTIADISVTPGMAAGSAFPADPEKQDNIFAGWWDESVTPNVRYTAATIIAKSVTLKARWVDSLATSITIKAGRQYISDVKVEALASTVEYLDNGIGYEHERSTAGNRFAYPWFKLDLGDKTLNDFESVKFTVESVTGPWARWALMASQTGSEFETDLKVTMINSSGSGYLANGQITEPQGSSPSGALNTFTLILNKEVGPGVVSGQAANVLAYNEVVFAQNEVILCFYEHAAAPRKVKVYNIEFIEKTAAGETVIYDMQTDPDLEDFHEKGSRTNHTSAYITTSLAASTTTKVDVTSNPKTLLVHQRGGSSQGVRLNLTQLNTITKAGHLYRIEYRGVFGEANSAEQGRFRLESGTIPSASNPVGIPAATSNILALSSKTVQIADTNRSFYVVWTVTKEEITAMIASASTTISFGNSVGSGTEPISPSITYTDICITEIAP